MLECDKNLGHDKCEFCTELQDLKNSYFYRLYHKTRILSRIVGENASFVVFPTIGQFMPYYLLIVPKRHIEKMAELTSWELEELQEIVEETGKKLSLYGNIVYFEHGGGTAAGTTCSVYHAHIHIMPVPSLLYLSSFLSGQGVIDKSNTLIECYHKLRKVEQYLMVRDADGSIYSTDTTKIAYLYSSQFFRKKINEYYGIQETWDWKKIKKIEGNVILTLEKIRILY